MQETDMRTLKTLVPLAAVGVLLAACGTTTTQRVATGALGGAAVGAVVDGGRGALIGGAAGAAGGAIVDAERR
jgi:osmotically inducible lipoprotein OsmB